MLHKDEPNGTGKRAEPAEPAAFGDRLEMALVRAKKRRNELAAFVGVNPATVSQWLGGAFLPEEDRIKAIADFLAVTPAWLRYGHEVPGGEGSEYRRLDHTAEVTRVAESAYDAIAREVREVREVRFDSANSAQKGRRWLEEFLTELADEGATTDFISSARRHLLNSDNYIFEVERSAGQQSAMNDDEKLEHMKGLATGVRAILRDRLKKEQRRVAAQGGGTPVPRPKRS